MENLPKIMFVVTKCKILLLPDMMTRVDKRNSLCSFCFCLLHHLHCSELKMGEASLPDHLHGLTEGLPGHGDEIDGLTRDLGVLGRAPSEQSLLEPHQHVRKAVELLENETNDKKGYDGEE